MIFIGPDHVVEHDHAQLLDHAQDHVLNRVAVHIRVIQDEADPNHPNHLKEQISEDQLKVNHQEECDQNLEQDHVQSAQDLIHVHQPKIISKMVMLRKILKYDFKLL